MSEQQPQPRPRRYRTLPEKVGSVVLGFESITVFLAGLAIFGLRALPEGIAPWWGVVGGSVMFVLLVAFSGTLRWRWGRIGGWVLQGIIALGALLVPAILLITIVFGSLWAYAMIGGGKIERRVAAERAVRGEADTPDA
ncbi:DUF4233 domain-containing protein [Microbacterium sp. gxy059]|uniref:DUF4233 domain-containing protein n=1 Tax=Microbacterium sp. gxy059 TaxID=2957199 RepID=UPI003D989C59